MEGHSSNDIRVSGAANDLPTSSKSAKASTPKMKNELKDLIDHFPEQVAHDGRLTRSRTRALASFVPSKQPSTSTSRPNSSTKSLFASGKDKISKKGRDSLRDNEPEAK
uniref:Uncharacterized protein n=1 Tax=Panagrolaimus superbus TaxID=310955 RepID=A0A914YCW0_9BILA